MQLDVILPRSAVLGSDMAYREAGSDSGPVVLFLHGNPTSSFIWRNVLPHVAPIARCIVVLPGSVIRKLSDEEMAVYRAPFAAPESRKPTWRLPNELPIAGDPADVNEMLEQAYLALASSRYPKLLFAGNPGALVSPAFAKAFSAKLHDCQLVQLGAGAHYLQEDHPETIGRSVADWIARNETRGTA